MMFCKHRPTPLVFFHIPKTGGQTVHRLLTGFYSNGSICPERFNRLDRFSHAQLMTFDLFSGHFDRKTVDSLPRRPRVITVLREPKARVLSLYYYWKSHKREVIEKQDLAGPRYAHEYGLLEFLRCPVRAIAPNIDNVQVRSMIGQMFVGPTREYLFPENEVLARAIAYLDSLFDFGVTEDLDRFVSRVFPRLGFEIPKSVPRRNSHQDFGQHKTMRVVEREEMTPAIEAELERLTCWDQKLYDYACRKLADRTGDQKNCAA